jgi:hypothetical protein
MSAVVPPLSADRLLASLRLLIRAETPTLTYAGTYEYSIQAVNGTAIDCSPVDTTIPLPSMSALPVRPSVLAESVTGIQTGQLCLVQFINADPTRPIVVSLSEISQTATIDAKGSMTVGSANTASVQLGGGVAPVARIGDLITVFLPLTPVPVSGVLQPGALNFNGFVTFTSPATGTITAGNPKVTA